MPYFVSFLLGIGQVICGNPIKALHARRQKLGVCFFSSILHISFSYTLHTSLIDPDKITFVLNGDHDGTS